MHIRAEHRRFSGGCDRRIAWQTTTNSSLDKWQITVVYRLKCLPLVISERKLRYISGDLSQDHILVSQLLAKDTYSTRSFMTGIKNWCQKHREMERNIPGQNHLALSPVDWEPIFRSMIYRKQCCLPSGDFSLCLSPLSFCRQYVAAFARFALLAEFPQSHPQELYLLSTHRLGLGSPERHKHYLDVGHIGRVETLPKFVCVWP